LWVNSWIAALVTGLITCGLMLWCAVAYGRRKDSTGFPHQLSYNLPLEVFSLSIQQGGNR
jgi:cytochrome c oxidase subunit 2